MSHDARQIRNEQKRIDSAISRRDGDASVPAHAMAVQVVRKDSAATWPEDTGYWCKVVTFSGGLTAGSLIVPSTSGALIPLILVGNGTPPDPSLGDATAQLYLLGLAVGGRCFAVYMDYTDEP